MGVEGILSNKLDALGFRVWKAGVNNLSLEAG